MPPLTAEFHLSDERVGLLSTAFLYAYMACAPILGRLAERFSRWWIIAGSVAEVEGGSRLADAASARVQDIVAGVQRVNATLGTINTSTRDQSDGIGHVNESVATLDRMTQQNAALVEQSAAAAESLKAQAAALVAAVARFRLEADALPAQ